MHSPSASASRSARASRFRIQRVPVGATEKKSGLATAYEELMRRLSLMKSYLWRK